MKDYNLDSPELRRLGERMKARKLRKTSQLEAATEAAIAELENKNEALRTTTTDYKLEEETPKAATVHTTVEEVDPSQSDYWKNFLPLLAVPESVRAVPINIPGWNGNDNKENARTAINFLTLMTDSDGNSIYSRNWANAIVGVLNAESGLVAGRVNPQEEARYGNNAGKGIAQWSNTVGPDGKLTSTRRSDYDSWMKDKDVTLENELTYFNYDLSNNRSKLYDYIKSHPDATLDEAVDMIHRWYENGSSNAAATRELMIATYAPAWERLGYRTYDFDQEHAARVARAKMAAGL